MTVSLPVVVRSVVGESLVGAGLGAGVTMDSCGDCISICATENRLEDRLIEVNVAEADCGELVDVKQVDEVAAAALADAEANTFCNTRCELAELLYFAA
eukprot:6205227-Pleurochrysis_carterae.AAC.3